MLSRKMEDALNAQINAEFYSSYLYLSMSAHCEALNYKGFANWFRVQSQEEMVHVMKFYRYVLDRKGRVELRPIQGPPTAWDSLVKMFEETLKHEQHVTSLIYNLVNLAAADGDHSTHTLLQWFINEQVEEEATADQILGELKLVADTPAGLYMLDRELGTRVFAPPAAQTAG